MQDEEVLNFFCVECMDGLGPLPHTAFALSTPEARYV